ncbi:MAG: hypothetical protein Q4F00_02970 [bacterium]|nr:hypothetical protein [bacterium]
MCFARNENYNKNSKSRASLLELVLNLLDESEIQQKLREVVQSRAEGAGESSTRKTAVNSHSMTNSRSRDSGRDGGPDASLLLGQNQQYGTQEQLATTPASEEQSREIKELKNQYGQLESQYAELNSSYAGLEKQHRELQQNYQELQRLCKGHTDANRELSQKLASAQQQCASLKEESERECSRIKAESEREIRQIRTSAQQEVSRAQEEVRRLADVARQKAEEKEEAVREITAKYQRDLDEAREREQRLRSQLNAKLTELQQQKNELEDVNEELDNQLQQRFPEGWDLYQRWENLRPASRQRLECLCRQPSFMSFICGGAQDDGLESIWDEMELCLREGAAADLQYLRELFSYAMQLVNASKSEEVYAQADEAAGQPYDMDRHTPDRSSRAQGRVTRVLLPGYRNLYLERIGGRVKMIRKSIVHVE